MVQGVPKSGTRCPTQDMGRVVPVSNGFSTTTETFSNTISILLAIAFRAETGKYYEADDWSKMWAQEIQKV